jgi:hypothetical protein
VDNDAGEEADLGARPNFDDGDAFATAVPAVGSSDVVPALIAAQQVLSRLLEQFGGLQPTRSYGVRAPLVAPDLAQGLRTANFHVAMALAAASSADVVDAKCNLAAGAVEIESRPDGPNNDLILRCRHDPPHCWTYTGTSIKCP